MSVDYQVSVIGVKQALAELNTIDKKYRRGLTTRYRAIMQPMVDAATRLVPVRAPMSGWNRSWDPKPGIQRGEDAGFGVLPWPFALLKRMDYRPRPFLSGKRPKTFGGYTRNLAAMGMRWDGRFATLFDASGQAATAQGRQMITTLGARYGAPSRAMWRAYEQAYPDVQQEVLDLVEEIMARVGRNIQIER